MVATPDSLSKFVTFCKQHIKGEEKKEAQTFLDRFFRAFGHEGALEAGATYEEAICATAPRARSPRVVRRVKQGLPIWFGNPAY